MTLKFNLPTDWNSLSNQQLLKLASLMFGKKSIPRVYFDYKIYCILSKRKWYKWLLNWKIKILFRQVSILTIKEYFSFIYNKQNLTRFIPVVKIKTKYYSPSSRLVNLSIGEFAICEDLYLHYLRNCKNSKTNFGYTYALALFSVLYINSESKKRPDFVKDLMQEKLNEIQNVPQKYVMACLLSYRGCKEAIATNPKYKNIFPKPKTEQKTIAEIPVSSGFSNLILSFAGNQFGNYNETFKTNLYTFLDNYEEELSRLKQYKNQN